MPLTLQVGEKRFTTTTEVLKGSGFLEALTSGRWDSNKQDDGSFFIDADPDIFAHILRFLRHEVFPVFYDPSKGHDFALYTAVLRQAEYFQIPPLVKWLKEKAYLQAVKVEHSAVLKMEESDIRSSQTADTEVEYHHAWKTVKVYVCPRGIGAHRGHQERCGKQCNSKQGEGELVYEDELILTILAVSKKMVFDQALCLGGD